MNVIVRAHIAGFICALLAGVAVSAAHADGGEEFFNINVGDLVGLSSPAPGAGEIARSGEVDVYHFSIKPASEMLVYFEEISGGCGLRWSCKAPDGAMLFDNNTVCVTDPGEMLLDQPGEYEIRFWGHNNALGTYSFKVWEVAEPDMFEIALNDLVAPGVPGPGAGEIEQPGSVDVYLLDLVAGDLVYFDEISGGCSLRWSCEAPDGTMLFSNNTSCITDPGLFEIGLTGTYEIRVDGNQSAVGTYSFQVWSVPPSDVFEIGLDEVVSQGSPGPGAGEIEQPGVEDVYILEVDAPVLVYFDELAGGCSIHWTCEAPDGTSLFNDAAMCITDPGEVLLDQVGEYVIRVWGNQSTTGTYSFEVVTVAPVDAFVIDLEQVVADGNPGPGAGNIEQPGSVDQYSFTLAQPTLVYFDELAGSCSIHWTCESPSGVVTFNDIAMCTTDPGLILLDEPGDYTCSVTGSQSAVGTYSFTIWEVSEPGEYVIALDEVVEENVPGKGAGFIAEPGEWDVYTLAAEAQTSACIETLSGSCGFSMDVLTPLGEPLLENATWCGQEPGNVFFDESGDYQIVVYGNQGATGSYSFIVNTPKPADLTSDCTVGVPDLIELLEMWGQCKACGDCAADLNDDCTIGVPDLILLLADWG